MLPSKKLKGPSKLDQSIRLTLRYVPQKQHVPPEVSYVPELLWRFPSPLMTNITRTRPCSMTQWSRHSKHMKCTRRIAASIHGKYSR